MVEVKGGSKRIIAKLKKHAIIVGAGYGKFKNQHMRIANFPAHTEVNMNLLLSILEDSKIKD